MNFIPVRFDHNRRPPRTHNTPPIELSLLFSSVSSNFLLLFSPFVARIFVLLLFFFLSGIHITFYQSAGQVDRGPKKEKRTITPVTKERNWKTRRSTHNNVYRHHKFAFSSSYLDFVWVSTKWWDEISTRDEGKKEVERKNFFVKYFKIFIKNLKKFKNL